MSVHNSVEERLLQYMGLVYHGYGLWTWYFSENGDLYYTNCPYEEQLKSFFCLGGCLDYAIAQKQVQTNPFLMSDNLGLIWLGEYVHHKGDESNFVVVGPAFHTYSSLHGIEDSLRQTNISIVSRKSSLEILSNIPVVNFSNFQSLARMLHYSIHFADTHDMDIHFQVLNGSQMSANEEKDDEKWKSAYHREQMLMQYIRDGNQNYSVLMNNMKEHGDVLIPKNKPLRNTKNSMIIFTAQAARAAIDGGLPVKIAKETESDYIGKIEQCTIPTHLFQIAYDMMKTFTDAVSEYKNYAASKPIRLCCGYIKKHISEPLTLEILASKIGYTEYYLARKFQKEMGIKLLDYIKQVRLDYAKILLSTTNMTIVEISEKLQFGTRNYFTKIFKESVGLTPIEYRNNSRKI